MHSTRAMHSPKPYGPLLNNWREENERENDAELAIYNERETTAKNCHNKNENHPQRLYKDIYNQDGLYTFLRESHTILPDRIFHLASLDKKKIFFFFTQVCQLKQINSRLAYGWTTHQKRLYNSRKHTNTSLMLVSHI